VLVARDEVIGPRIDRRSYEIVIVQIIRNDARRVDRILEHDAFLVKPLDERFDVRPFESILPSDARMLKRSPHFIEEVWTHHELDSAFLPVAQELGRRSGGR
jgi:hypothetical protein